MPRVQTRTAAPENRETNPAPAPPMSCDVRIHALHHPCDGALRGVASVNLNGQFAVRRIKIMEGPNGLFVSMPRFKDRNGEFKDYCFPCTKDARVEFEKAVFEAYEQARAGIKGQTQAAPEALPLRYDIRIHSLHPGDGVFRGMASVNLNGQFAVRRIKIMEGPNGLFVSMPKFKDRNGEFKNYCFPCTKEARAEFDKAVLGAYDRTLTQSREPERRMEAPGPFEAGAQARAPELRM